MVSQGFERVIQTTAQIANEVPGAYRLHNAQLTTAQVVEMIRLALTSLGCNITVQVMKVQEEFLFTSSPSGADAGAKTKSEPGGPPSPGNKAKAQSGYPAWRRPRLRHFGRSDRGPGATLGASPEPCNVPLARHLYLLLPLPSRGALTVLCSED